MNAVTEVVATEQIEAPRRMQCRATHAPSIGLNDIRSYILDLMLIIYAGLQHAIQ